MTRRNEFLWVYALQLYTIRMYIYKLRQNLAHYHFATEGSLVSSYFMNFRNVKCIRMPARPSINDSWNFQILTIVYSTMRSTHAMQNAYKITFFSLSLFFRTYADRFFIFTYSHGFAAATVAAFVDDYSCLSRFVPLVKDFYDPKPFSFCYSMLQHIQMIFKGIQQHTHIKLYIIDVYNIYIKYTLCSQCSFFDEIIH